MTPLNTRIERTDEEIEAGVCPVPDGSEVSVFSRSGRRSTTFYPQYKNWGDASDYTITAYEIHAIPTPDHGPAILAGLRAMPPETWPLIALGIEGVSELTADEVIQYLEGDG